MGKITPLPRSRTSSTSSATTCALHGCLSDPHPRPLHFLTTPRPPTLCTSCSGWGNVAYHRDRSPAGPSKEVVTPNLDELVKTGIELDRFYTYKFCSPSRSSLMTGRFSQHVNMHNLALTVPRHGIPINMTTVASKLKTAGYATHAVGKWHCGMASEAQTPTGKGFDTYFGYFDGYNDYLHSLSGTTGCPGRPGTVTYGASTADAPKCTGSSVIARHLTSATDLWLNDHPAHGLNGTGFEEALFLERVLGRECHGTPRLFQFWVLIIMNVINQHMSSTQQPAFYVWFLGPV